jgi:hypothetical protein
MIIGAMAKAILTLTTDYAWVYALGRPCFCVLRQSILLFYRSEPVFLVIKTGFILLCFLGGFSVIRCIMHIVIKSAIILGRKTLVSYFRNRALYFKLVVYGLHGFGSTPPPLSSPASEHRLASSSRLQTEERG